MSSKHIRSHKDEELNNLRIKDDSKFEDILNEHHEYCLSPQQIKLIENAHKFLIRVNGEFVPNFDYTLIGMKFGTLFVMGANEVTCLEFGANHIVIENKLTGSVVKFINENYIKEVLQNVG